MAFFDLEAQPVIWLPESARLDRGYGLHLAQPDLLALSPGGQYALKRAESGNRLSLVSHLSSLEEMLRTPAESAERHMPSLPDGMDKALMSEKVMPLHQAEPSAPFPWLVPVAQCARHCYAEPSGG